MNKKIALLICIITAVMTVATVAFARYDPDEEGCGYWRMEEVYRSNPYNYMHKMVRCSINSNQCDVVTTYCVDVIWRCTTPNCPEQSTKTITYTEVDCEHGR